MLFEKIVVSRLEAWAAKTSWEGDDILIGSFKGTFPFLILILEGYSLSIFKDFNNNILITLANFTVKTNTKKIFKTFNFICIFFTFIFTIFK